MRGIIHRMRAAAASLAVSARPPASPSGAGSGSNRRPDAFPSTGPPDRLGGVGGARLAHDDLRQTLSHLAEIAELQRLELARLLDQNRRLNGRIDRLLVLQQRDQAWRERLAGTLQRLAVASPSSAHPPVPVANGGDPTRVAAAEARYTALRQSVGQLVGQLANQPRTSTPTLQRPSAVGDTHPTPPLPRR